MTESPYWSRSRLAIPLIACLAAVSAGCGGGTDEALPDAPARVAPREADPAPRVPARVARTPRETRPGLDDWPAARSVRPRGPADELDPDADPRDVFEIVDEPNFEIVETGRGVSSADVFDARRPQPGHNASTFVIVEHGPGPPSGRPDPDFRLPAGFAALAEAGYSEHGLPRRIRSERDGAEMALVPAGVSLLGTPGGPPETTPQLSVYLDSFYIDVTEVTLAQYARYVDERRATATRPLQEPLNRGSAPDMPALGLSWGAARDYALWAGKELPTEAQWEKAARGPTGFDHPWGNGRPVFPRARTLTQIDPAGSFPLDQSPYGVLDLAGNAREWCLDFYSDRAFQAAASADEAALANWEGPRRPSAEYQRVVRGNGPGWKVWHRAGLSMREQRPDVGFRCVLRVPAQPAEPAGDPARPGARPRGR